MKTFQNRAAQGDFFIRRIEKLPDGLVESQEKKQHIVAHSETGHHHVVDALPNVKFYKTDNPLVSYLEVIEATDAVEVLVKHLRDYDTHEAIKIPVGIFELRNQREYTPEGWRRAQD
jgi:hypothetical protein